MAITLNNNPQHQLNNIKLAGVDLEFFNELNNEITLFGQLPYNVPRGTIIYAVRDAAKFFYEWHPRADKITNFLIDVNRDFINGIKKAQKDVFGSHDERGIYLPLKKSISVVRKVHESNVGHKFQDMIDEDFSNLGTGMGYSSGFGINNNDFFTNITTRMVEMNMIKSLLGTTISFNYNQMDKVLYLKTLPKSKYVMIECREDIPLYNFYNNFYFKKLALLYSKKNLKRLIAGHTFQLPGDVTLNADEICDGVDNITEFEQTIKAQSTMGNIILKK